MCGIVIPATPREIAEREGVLEEIKVAQAKKDRRRRQGQCKTLPDLIKLGEELGHRYPEAWARRIWSARQAKNARPI